MKKIAVLIVYLFLAVVVTANSISKKNIKPENVSDTVNVKILGRKYVYYLIDEKAHAKIDIQGPAKLKIYTRVACSSQQKNITYKVLYSIDGSMPVSKKFSHVPVSLKAKFLRIIDFVPSENRNVIISIPKGKHRLEVFSEITAGKVYAKFHLIKQKRKKRKKWVDIQPLGENNPVNLIIKENAFTYYRLKDSDTLKLRVIGPTKLKILTRLEIKNPLKKESSYRISISDNGKLFKSYLLQTRRSYSVRYRNETEFMPNKARVIFISVPEGKHIYVISTPDKERNILMRFFIPTKDINLRLEK